MASTTSAASSKDPTEDEQQQQQPSSSSSSILSRSTLYAPLVAYNNNQTTTTTTTGCLPKNVTEKALTSFLESTCTHFHLSQDSLHGKNTAGRPMSEKEYKDRLLQKGLTLVGGGFYRKKRSNSSSGGRRRRRRRKKRQKLVKTTQKDKDKIPDFVWKDQMQFVKDLNRNWNAYAWNMLLFSSSSSLSLSSETTRISPLLPLLSKRAKLLSRTMEWCGARVRLDRRRCCCCCGCTTTTTTSSSSTTCRCTQQWGVGCQGILLGETTRTWEVFRMDDTRNHGEETRTLIVPKRDATLTVLLPMFDENEKKEGTSENAPSLASTKYVCLVLEDSRTKSKK